LVLESVRRYFIVASHLACPVFSLEIHCQAALSNSLLLVQDLSSIKKCKNIVSSVR